MTTKTFNDIPVNTAVYWNSYCTLHTIINFFFFTVPLILYLAMKNFMCESDRIRRIYRRYITYNSFIWKIQSSDKVLPRVWWRWRMGMWFGDDDAWGRYDDNGARNGVFERGGGADTTAAAPCQLTWVQLDCIVVARWCVGHRLVIWWFLASARHWIIYRDHVDRVIDLEKNF